MTVRYQQYIFFYFQNAYDHDDVPYPSVTSNQQHKPSSAINYL